MSSAASGPSATPATVVAIPANIPPSAGVGANTVTPAVALVAATPGTASAANDAESFKSVIECGRLDAEGVCSCDMPPASAVPRSG